MTHMPKKLVKESHIRPINAQAFTFIYGAFAKAFAVKLIEEVGLRDIRSFLISHEGYICNVTRIIDEYSNYMC